MTNETTNAETHEIVNPICAGIDVHRDFVCVTLAKTQAGKTNYQYSKHRTVKRDLIELRDWLLANDCPVVGLESTGKYWLPIQKSRRRYS